MELSEFLKGRHCEPHKPKSNFRTIPSPQVLDKEQVPTSFVGKEGNQIRLGEPDLWVEVNMNGRMYKMPLYK